MSIKVMNRVWEHSKNKGSALLLLLAIADHAHDDGTGAWPSIRTLAQKTRMSERNVQYLIRTVERTGELKVLNGEGPHGCNAYAIELALSRGEKFAPLKSSAGGVQTSAGGVKSSVNTSGATPFTRTKNHNKPPGENRHIERPFVRSQDGIRRKMQPLFRGEFVERWKKERDNRQ